MFPRRIISASIILLLVFSACRKEEVFKPQPSSLPPVSSVDTGVVAGPCFPPADNDNMLLGNPTRAERFIQYPDNYLLDHQYYIEGYSNQRGIPLWVSWHLESSDLGSTPRQNDFRPDDNLPPNIFYLVQAWAYSGSGFDRGHNCPSADRTSSVAANSSTFYMTNMIPQAPALNQGPWAVLENYIRNTLVGSNYEAFIVMGAYGQGGIPKNSPNNAEVYTLDNSHVTVPEKVFKIAIIIPKGIMDFSRIDTSARVLAVTMPNENQLYLSSSGNPYTWQDFRTSISAIEADAAARGIQYDLLRNISDTALKNYLKHKMSVN